MITKNQSNGNASGVVRSPFGGVVKAPQQREQNYTPANPYAPQSPFTREIIYTPANPASSDGGTRSGSGSSSRVNVTVEQAPASSVDGGQVKIIAVSRQSQEGTPIASAASGGVILLSNSGTVIRNADGTTQQSGFIGDFRRQQEEKTKTSEEIFSRGQPATIGDKIRERVSTAAKNTFNDIVNLPGDTAEVGQRLIEGDRFKNIEQSTEYRRAKLAAQTVRSEARNSLGFFKELKSEPPILRGFGVSFDSEYKKKVTAEEGSAFSQEYRRFKPSASDQEVALAFSIYQKRQAGRTAFSEASILALNAATEGVGRAATSVLFRRGATTGTVGFTSRVFAGTAFAGAIEGGASAALQRAEYEQQVRIKDVGIGALSGAASAGTISSVQSRLDIGRSAFTRNVGKITNIAVNTLDPGELFGDALATGAQRSARRVLTANNILVVEPTVSRDRKDRLRLGVVSAEPYQARGMVETLKPGKINTQFFSQAKANANEKQTADNVLIGSYTRTYTSSRPTVAVPTKTSISTNTKTDPFARVFAPVKTTTNTKTKVSLLTPDIPMVPFLPLGFGGKRSGMGGFAYRVKRGKVGSLSGAILAGGGYKIRGSDFVSGLGVRI